MRERMEASRPERDLKRGFGGIVDVEFLVQLLQLKYGGANAALRFPNTWQALEVLAEAGMLTPNESSTLKDGYDFLRLVESRLRIVHNRSLDELPEDPDDLEKLARRLGCAATAETSAGTRFLGDLERHTTQIRELFLRLVRREGEMKAKSKVKSQKSKK